MEKPVDTLDNGIVVRGNLLEETATQADRKWKKRSYRAKLLYTFCLSCLGFLLGWVVMQNGATFLDINLITNVDVETGAWYASGNTIGYLFGSLIAGALYDVTNKYLLILLTILGSAVTAISLPWTSQFGLMVFAYVVLGAFGGGVDTEITAEITRIWNKKSGTFYEVYYFSYALGGCISPLVSNIFLAKKRETLPTHSCGNSSNYSAFSNTGQSSLGNDSFYDLLKYSSYQNASVYNTTASNTETNCSSGSSLTDSAAYGVSNVQYAYMVSGILYFICAIPFILYFLSRQSTASPKEHKTDSNSMKKSLQLQLLAVIGLLICFYQGVEGTFAYFIMMFVVDFQGWSKTNGTTLSSLFRITSACTLFVGIFVLKKLEPFKILCFLSSLMIVSLSGLIIAAHLNNDVMIWIFTGIGGVSMSMYCPSVFTLTKTRCFDISGRVAGYFIAMVCVGSAINPVLIGFLVEEYDGIWFLYVLLIQAIVLFILLIIWKIILRYKVANPNI